MNIVFPSVSHTNSPVVDSATGRHLFQVSTPFGFRSRSTTLWDAQWRVVGKYKTGWVHDEVTHNGRTMKLSEWLVERSTSSLSGRTFVAQNGRSYEWQWETLGSEGYKLIDCQTKELIARGHRKHTKLFSHSQKMSIDVLANGLPVLDAIVLSFVLCEKIRRREDISESRSAARRTNDASSQQLQATMAAQNVSISLSAVLQAGQAMPPPPYYP